MKQQVGQFVDKARVIAIASVFATFLGLAGMFTLAAACAVLLAEWMHWAGALAVTAVGFLALAAIALWVGIKPSRALPDEEPEPADPTMESAFSALTDLPLEMARKIITERPIAALAVFSGFGVLIARRPDLAMKMVDKLINRFTGEGL
jgi:hypothetical protein